MKKNLKKSIIKVYKSRKYIYAYLINSEGKTQFSMSSLHLKLKLTVDNARTVGEKFSELIKSNNIGDVVFDRNGFKFHGRVKALADGIRSGGVNF